ncbi:hypothetical protein BCR39DRAFT_518381 [Naematelia encephala]|uniref:Exosome complex protein n=1 Tax=Naematelia encephala TaxID=71784 RepID=A0A1Y2BHN2_9TREE|nr:hypothetical protein BCR39DRAFT_518381 [Naematelia encephala]
MSEFDPTSTSSLLSSTLDDLEASLEPLHARPFSETRDELDQLSRAKIDIMLSYAIHDLIWVYLKMKGIDPNSHLVTPELERIKTYYSKVRRAEEPEQIFFPSLSTLPPLYSTPLFSTPFCLSCQLSSINLFLVIIVRVIARKSKIDIPAARRHIHHSLPNSGRPASTSTNDLPASDAASRAREEAMEAVRESTSKRFRFVAEHAEKVVPGQAEKNNTKGKGRENITGNGTGTGNECNDIEAYEDEQELVVEDEAELQDGEDIGQVEKDGDEVERQRGLLEDAEAFMREVQNEMEKQENMDVD